MSAVPPPPATEPSKDAVAEEKPATEATLSWSSVGGWMVGATVTSVLFLIIFHSGAAYLSYQKYQSGLWALVNFFFAGFYYPYYAFFLASQPPPQQGILMGGRRRMGGRR